MAASSSTLPYFWQLASASTSERLDASHKLVTTLQAAPRDSNYPESYKTSAQKQHLFDDGLARGTSTDQVTTEELEAAEAGLGASLSAEAAYTVRRLIKGLGSHRESARLGFSVALAEVLAHLPDLVPRHALTLVLAYSRTNAKMRGQEERDLLFARLFGIATMMRSGVLTHGDRAEWQDWTRAIEALLALGRTKTWLRESTAAVIVSAIEMWQGQKAALTRPPWHAQSLSWLAEKMCEDHVATPESVAIFLALKSNNPAVLKPAQRLPHFASQEILARLNLSTLSRILCGRSSQETKEARADDEDDDASDVEQSDSHVPAGSSSVRAHFVWDAVLKDAMNETSSTQASFGVIFRTLVDEGLFANSASHQKKAWGFQIVERALRLASVQHIPLIMTQNVLRTLINQLSAKDRVLHRAAQKVSLALQDVVKLRPEMGSAVIAVLTGPHGAQRFDAATSSKTIDGILRRMHADDVAAYSQTLMTAACDDLPDSQRRQSLDQLLNLVRDGQIPTTDQCQKEILTFFSVHGFLQVKRGTKKGGVSTCSVPSAPFSSSMQSAFRSRFLSCINDLYNLANADQPRKADQSDAPSLWIIRAYDIVDGLAKDVTHHKELSAAHCQAMENALEMNKRLAALAKRGKDEEEGRRIADYRAVLLATVLYVRNDLIGATSAERGDGLLQPLVDCGDRLLLGKKHASGEPHVAELLVHSLATLLEEPSALLRSAAVQAFNSFSDHMTRESIKHLVQLLGFDAEDSTVDESNVSSSDEEDGNADAASMSETSATSSSSDEDEEDEEVDEKFAAEIHEALKAGGIADNDVEGLESGSVANDASEGAGNTSDEESSVASDFDDEQMMLVDDKLADIFRQKFSSRKEENEAKKETVAFHIRVIALLDNFVKRHSASSLCLEIVLPLLTIALEKDPAMDQLKARAASVLQKTMARSRSWPTEASSSEVVPTLEAIHKMVMTGIATGQHLNLVALCNTYMTRAATHEVLEREVAAVYADTLNDFITRKASNLKPQFLIAALSRFPVLGYVLRHQLLEAASGPQQNSQHSFRQVQALEMLRATLVNVIGGQSSLSTPTSQNQINELTTLLTQLRTLTLSRASQDHLRLKEIIKLALHFVRLTKKLADKSAEPQLVERIWPVAEIEAAITVLGSTHIMPNSSSLQSLLRQMISVVSSSTAAAAVHGKMASPSTSSKKRASPEPHNSSGAVAPTTKTKRSKKSQ